MSSEQRFGCAWRNRISPIFCKRCTPQLGIHNLQIRICHFICVNATYDVGPAGGGKGTEMDGEGISFVLGCDGLG